MMTPTRKSVRAEPVRHAMGTGWRDRLFSRVAELGLGRPALVLGLWIALLALAGTLIPGLGVSTSRTGLVSDEDPDQQRMHAFYERFGRPDAPLFVVDGGTPEERRAVVDALQAELEAIPGLKGRVLGRIEAEDVAEILLLQRPEAVAEFRRSVPPGVDLPAVIEGGLEAWLGMIEAQMLAGLDGAAPDDGAAPSDDDGEATAGAGDDGAGTNGVERAPPGGPSLEASVAGLEQLAMMARLLDDHLAGRDVLDRLSALPGASTALDRAGIDDRGYLVSSSADAHLVVVYTDLPSDEGQVLAPVVQGLRAARDAALEGAPEGVRAELTGLPSLSVDELRIVEEGLRSSSVATTIGILLLCLALFRSVRQTIVALVPLLPGVVLTVAAVRLIYDDLNLITSSFVAVLMGLGIDFSVHLVSRNNEGLREGIGRREAAANALRRTGPGIMTGASITAAGFLATATTEFTAYGELGVITAIGLVVTMLAAYFLVPLLLTVGKEGRSRVAPEPPGLRYVPSFVRRLRVPLAVVGFAGAIAGGLALPTIEFNPRYFDFLPESTESARALAKLEYDPLASPVFASLSADSVEAAREMTAALRAKPTVAGVQSATDLLPPLDDAALGALRSGLEGLREPDFAALARRESTADGLVPRIRGMVDALDEVRFALQGVGIDEAPAIEAHKAFSDLLSRVENLDADGKERLRTLHARVASIVGPAWTTAAAVAERGHYVPTDLPEIFERRFVSKDGKALAIHAIPAGRFWEADVAEAFSRDVRGIDEDATGLALIHVRHGQMVLAGFQRAAALAAGIILVLLVLDFRALGTALLALLPTILGWAWMLGIMKIAGLDFDVANIVALPLVLGIGIAFGVHMMHRARESARGGRSADVEEVVRGTGGAIAVSALTTMVGFAGLMLGEYGGMKSLGGVMVIGIGSCLVATLVVLPAVLLILRQAK